MLLNSNIWLFMFLRYYYFVVVFAENKGKLRKKLGKIGKESW